MGAIKEPFYLLLIPFVLVAVLSQPSTTSGSLFEVVLLITCLSGD